jgi:uncharacterized repeat protein (TIGR03833 family)
MIGDIMDQTLRNNIKIGAKVMVVQKQDQRTGKLTEGIVMRILTNSRNHPRGIKVMLENGIVGRVQRICDISTPGPFPNENQKRY